MRTRFARFLTETKPLLDASYITFLPQISLSFFLVTLRFHVSPLQIIFDKRLSQVAECSNDYFTRRSCTKLFRFSAKLERNTLKSNFAKLGCIIVAA